MKFILFLLPVLFLIPVQAQQCPQKKQEAFQKCSPENLASAKAKLDAGASAVSSRGAATSNQVSQGSVTGALAELTAINEACSEAIKQCGEICQKEAQQQSQNPATQSMAQQSMKFAKECTEGPPKKANEQGKKEQAGMEKILPEILKALAAMMAQKGQEKPQTPPQDNTCNGTKAGTDACISKANNTSSDFASGSMREGEGAIAEGDVELAANDPAKGAAAKVEYSKGGGGGGSSGGGFGSFGAGGPSTASARKDDTKDNGPRINFGSGASGGGGGGKGGFGGGGSGFSNHNNAASSRTALEADKNVIAIAEKALQSRGTASDGPLGGITAAHSFDNFIKVEKRIQAERNGLYEH